jgi:hypothetical protein
MKNLFLFLTLIFSFSLSAQSLYPDVVVQFSENQSNLTPKQELKMLNEIQAVLDLNQPNVFISEINAYGYESFNTGQYIVPIAQIRGANVWNAISNWEIANGIPVADQTPQFVVNSFFVRGRTPENRRVVIKFDSQL